MIFRIAQQWFGILGLLLLHHIQSLGNVITATNACNLLYIKNDIKAIVRNYIQGDRDAILFIRIVLNILNCLRFKFKTKLK
jgi:hypothetical protein